MIRYFCEPEFEYERFYTNKILLGEHFEILNAIKEIGVS